MQKYGFETQETESDLNSFNKRIDGSSAVACSKAMGLLRLSNVFIIENGEALGILMELSKQCFSYLNLSF